MPECHALLNAARACLPAGVAVAWADPTQRYALLAGEALPGAVPHRLREFSAGRHAAREAMSKLGRALTPIPMGDDRAPVWPQGITGSITHSQRACLAAISHDSVLRGLGLDLEEESPLPADLWDTVLRPEERAWLATQPAADRGSLAKFIFSAKEASYKAQYALSRSLFGFDTLHIMLSGTAFTAQFQDQIAPFSKGATIAGTVQQIDGQILATAIVPA